MTARASEAALEESWAVIQGIDAALIIGEMGHSGFLKLPIDPRAHRLVGLLLSVADLGAGDDLVPGLFFHDVLTVSHNSTHVFSRAAAENSATAIDPPGQTNVHDPSLRDVSVFSNKKLA